MTNFDDLFAAVGLPGLMDQFGESAIYTPDGGAAVTLTAIVEEETARELEGPDGRQLERVRTVQISTDPGGPYGGVASPEITATVTYDGVDYRIEAIGPSDPGMVSLDLVRVEDLEKSRPGYRASRR